VYTSCLTWDKFSVHEPLTRTKRNKLAPRRHIGKILKAARLRKNLNAEEVARRCNVVRSRIYGWEKGNYVFEKNIPALSKALGIPIEILERANIKKAD
jgi:transcriptional regulator with XRE-family HTH domain